MVYKMYPTLISKGVDSIFFTKVAPCLTTPPLLRQFVVKIVCDLTILTSSFKVPHYHIPTLSHSENFSPILSILLHFCSCIVLSHRFFTPPPVKFSTPTSQPGDILPNICGHPQDQHTSSLISYFPPKSLLYSTSPPTPRKPHIYTNNENLKTLKNL